ncbi:MAG: DUF115 domain-containing protein [Pseudodesulfovibrio sp.]
MPIIRSVEAYLSQDDWENELVFVFGDSDVDSSIPEQFVVRIPSSKFVDPENFCSTLDVSLLKNGFTFVANEETGIKDGQHLQQLQMYIAAAYYQGHFFNQRTPYKPDGIIQGLLGTMADPTRSISQLKNMPWLLRSPIVDKIQDKKLGLPVLIVIPGPSRNRIREKLKKYAKHCLVICIARSLKFCLDAGVEPDFVMQYDTHLEQRHFYDDMPVLEKTVLISLSSASIASYAWKFRGVVFRASFNQILLKNQAVLRDSTEGSLLACMGLAEILMAPRVFMAGCDFCWDKENGRYNSEKEPAKTFDSGPIDYRIRIGKPCELAERGGKMAYSQLGYVSAAARASEFAGKIEQSTGTKFYLTSDTGILSSKKFPIASEDVICETPELDRDAYMDAVDDILYAKENIDFGSALSFFKERADILNVQELHFRIKKYNPDFEFELYDQFLRVIGNIRSFVMRFDGQDAQVHRLVEAWANAYNYATKIAYAYVLAQKESIPVLCTESDYAHLTERIDSFFPKEDLDFWILCNFTKENKEKHAHEVRIHTITAWMKRHKMIFISHTILEEFGYLFESLACENVIVLPSLKVS